MSGYNGRLFEHVTPVVLRADLGQGRNQCTLLKIVKLIVRLVKTSSSEIRKIFDAFLTLAKCYADVLDI